MPRTTMMTNREHTALWCSQRTVFICILLLLHQVECFVSRCFTFPNGVEFSTELLASSFQLDETDGPWSSALIEQHWGSSPILIRQAFSKQELEESIPSWDEVIGLACSEEDESDQPTSRVIRHTRNTLDTFTLDFGPFNSNAELDLESSGEKVSTLIVNDVDRCIPSVSDWMDDKFSFLPRWRRDDAQISLARIGGGIGLHVDNYDVFLIQTYGTRIWKVGNKVDTKQEYDGLVEPSEVRVLDLGDEPTIETELHPGDCLYLPPRYVHQGISSSPDCMTLSIGGRAPSASELLSRVAERVSSCTSPSAVKFYTDPNLIKDYHRGTSYTKALDERVKDDLKSLVRDAVEEVLHDDTFFDELVGKLLTEPRRPLNDVYPTTLGDMDEEWKNELGIWADESAALLAVLHGDGALFRIEGASCAYSSVISHDDNGGTTIHRIFAQGEVYELKVKQTEQPELENVDIGGLMIEICNGQPLDKASLSRYGVDETTPQTILAFLKELIYKGLLYGSSETEKEKSTLE